MSQAFNKIIRQVISGQDEVARTSFLSNFSDEIEAFTIAMVPAFEAWEKFNSKNTEDDTRNKISNLIYCSINSHVVAMELLLTGHMIPSGNTMRQVLEAIAMGLLSSKSELDFLERFSQNRYSTSKSIQHVLRNSEILNINKEAVKTLQESETFYHQFSHITLMTIALNQSISNPDDKPLGGFFDEGKMQQYKIEIDGRIKLANIFPNLIHGIESNLDK